MPTGEGLMLNPLAAEKSSDIPKFAIGGLPSNLWHAKAFPLFVLHNSMRKNNIGPAAISVVCNTFMTILYIVQVSPQPYLSGGNVL